MTIIQRSYLQKLINVIGTSDIKVITGVRRSWKSELLSAFKKYIENSIPNNNIIDINFSDYKYKSIRSASELYKYVESKYDPLKQNFLLIDEVQMCDGFEDVINSFHASEKYDIYLTWSNAFLLSSDLATLFTWRTFEISIFPFSFEEFIKYYKYEEVDLAFWEYIDKWWMAWSYQYETADEKNCRNSNARNLLYHSCG
jgi:predicted AAA+ superfamily ATPase